MKDPTIPWLNDPSLLRDTCLLDGAWIKARSGDTIAVTNPADGSLVGLVPALSDAEIEDAIAAADRALAGWRQRAAKDRSSILRRWFDLITAHADDLAAIMTAEQGKPLAEARGEIAYAASFVEWFAEEAKRVYGDTIPSPQSDKRLTVIRQPVGVTAAITPWNFPAAMITRKAAPALLRADLHARLSQWVFHLPPLRERREDMRAHLLDLLEGSERQLGRKTGFNTDALARYLRFAEAPATPWPGNLRDLQASAHRMAVLAERGRITLTMVEAEIATLCAQWRAAEPDGDAALLDAVLPGARLDEFDRTQLAAVIRACRGSASLSAAGRRLFAVSREDKASANDADRLRKYLARFGLDWATVTSTRSG